MTNEQDNPPERGNWFWIAIIAALFAILAYWFYDPVGEVPVAEQPGAGMPGDEFTAAPQGGVPVQLPETPMTSTPVETGTPENSQTPPPVMAE